MPATKHARSFATADADALLEPGMDALLTVDWPSDSGTLYESGSVVQVNDVNEDGGVARVWTAVVEPVGGC